MLDLSLFSRLDTPRLLIQLRSFEFEESVRITMKFEVAQELLVLYMSIFAILHCRSTVSSGDSSTNQEAGILIVSTEWWPISGNIPRNILQEDLTKLLTRHGNVYMTVFEPSDAEKMDAEKQQIKLIQAKKLHHDKLSLTERLLRHKYYFPSLKNECANITIIIGYAMMNGTVDAARSIHEEIFPNANFVPILSYIPEDLDKEPDEIQDLEYEIMQYVEKARFAISIGPKVHSHFTIKFNALKHKPEHIEFLPGVDDQILNRNISNLDINDQIHLLTFDFSSRTVDKCTESLKTVALASGKIANYFANRIRTKLKIRGLPEKIGKQCQENLLKISGSPYLDIIHYPSSVTIVHLQNTILKDFSQCHLHIHAPTIAPFGFTSLLASAAGVPSLSTGLSGFSGFIKRDLTYHYDTFIVKDFGINQLNEESAEILKEKCVETLVEPRLYKTFLKKTKDLQRDLKESMKNGAIAESHAKLLEMFNTVISERKQATQELPTKSEDDKSDNASTEVLIQIDVKVTEPADILSQFESCDNLTRLGKLLHQIGSTCQHVKINSLLAIVVSCPTMKTLEDLWERYKNDFLLQVICLDISTFDASQNFDCDDICDNVIIESWRYRRARLELNSLIEGTCCNTDSGSVKTPMHTTPDENAPLSENNKS
ncbi:uncharacterized protein [Ptychodera flava]|uniref:uncharacterized protein isoform X2 n=1 Tax=Ptychodera flava TaxID=63121 RepID=UPI00396A6F6D